MKFFILLMIYLARLLKESPEKGLREVFKTFQQDILTFLSIKLQGNEEVCEEIYQDAALAFIKAVAEKRYSFENDAKVKNFLITISMNKLRDWARKNKKSIRKTVLFKDRESMELCFEQLSDPRQSLENSVIHQETENHLSQLVNLILSEMSENYQTVLKLKFIEDLSNQKIADQMKIGLKAAESLLYRARQDFRKQLYRKGIGEELFILMEGSKNEEQQ